MIYAEPPRISA